MALGLLLFVCAPGLFAAELTSRELLDHVDDLFRGQSSYGRFTMAVVTEHYSRELSLEAWSRGKDDSLIRILAPKKERGTATLKVGTNMWNYLPKVKRVIKIPSSMMGGAWMGSHFTNDDLVKESRMADDYTHEITFEGLRDGQKMLELTLIPLENAAVVWGKVVVLVRASDLMPITLTYYDEDLVLTRTMIFSEVKNLGGRDLPVRLRMQPQDKPGEYTEILYQEMKFNLNLSDDLFSLRTLQQ